MNPRNWLPRHLRWVGLALALYASARAAQPVDGTAAIERSTREAWIDVPFDSPTWTRWQVDATREAHLGRDSIYLRSGMLWLPDAEFTDGVIEFDIACSGQRGFVGAAWRIQDRGNLEHFYLRPHQSGQPDSCQYTPVDHGSSAWQLFPQGSTAIDFDFDRWMTVRLVVWRDQLQVFVDSDEPRLLTRLRRPIAAGGIGILAPGYEPAHFSQFRYRSLDEPPSDLLPLVEEERSGVVRSWSVSSAFPEAELDGHTELPKATLAGLEWSTVRAEPFGVTNLARVQGVDGGADTALARLVLHADEARTVRVDFGFSDRVKVYQDRALIFEADDSYRSRDARFLGTIGLYDRLTLRLHPGPNEVLFAVSESFGGWGLMAVVPETEGLRLE